MAHNQSLGITQKLSLSLHGSLCICALIFTQLTKKPHKSYTGEQFIDKTINIFGYFPIHILIHYTELGEINIALFQILGEAAELDGNSRI